MSQASPAVTFATFLGVLEEEVQQHPRLTFLERRTLTAGIDDARASLRATPLGAETTNLLIRAVSALAAHSLIQAGLEMPPQPWSVADVRRLLMRAMDLAAELIAERQRGTMAAARRSQVVGAVAVLRAVDRLVVHLREATYREVQRDGSPVSERHAGEIGLLAHAVLAAASIPIGWRLEILEHVMERGSAPFLQASVG